MSPERDRVISISLTEAEWQAFVARHPEPVDWLRARIKNESMATQSLTGQSMTDESTRVAGGQEPPPSPARHIVA